MAQDPNEVVESIPVVIKQIPEKDGTKVVKTAITVVATVLAIAGGILALVMRKKSSN